VLCIARKRFCFVALTDSACSLRHACHIASNTPSDRTKPQPNLFFFFFCVIIYIYTYIYIYIYILHVPMVHVQVCNTIFCSLKLTYMSTYAHTYIYTYIHIYVQTNIQVIADGPAASANPRIEPGDVLREVDGVYVTSLAHAKDLLLGKPGTPVTMRLMRNQYPLQVTLIRNIPGAPPVTLPESDGEDKDVHGKGKGKGVDKKYVKGIPKLYSRTGGAQKGKKSKPRSDDEEQEHEHEQIRSKHQRELRAKDSIGGSGEASDEDAAPQTRVGDSEIEQEAVAASAEAVAAPSPGQDQSDGARESASQEERDGAHQDDEYEKDD
jgi:hypothetical protein